MEGERERAKKGERVRRKEGKETHIFPTREEAFF
jgi:hypothetical protein